MRTRVRPIIVLILCGMLLLGHVPAWLHAVACHEVSLEMARNCVAVSTCGHCHGGCDTNDSLRRRSGGVRSDRVSAGSVVGSLDHRTAPHDESHCVVCQSIAGHSAALAVYGNLAVVVPSSFSTVAIPNPLWSGNQVAKPKPRGPPHTL